jgi:hypothetical protein
MFKAQVQSSTPVRHFVYFNYYTIPAGLCSASKFKCIVVVLIISTDMGFITLAGFLNTHSALSRFVSEQSAFQASACGEIAPE